MTDTARKDSINEQLKTLREQRGPVSESLLKLRKEQMKIQEAILSAVQNESKTVPQISQETNLPTQEVFWHITAMRKYGKIIDVKKSGDYMVYKKA